MRVIRCCGPINDKLETSQEKQRLAAAANNYFTKKGMPNSGSKIAKGVQPLSRDNKDEK